MYPNSCAIVRNGRLGSIFTKKVTGFRNEIQFNRMKSIKPVDPIFKELCCPRPPYKPPREAWLRKTKLEREAEEAERQMCCRQYKSKIPRKFSSGRADACPKPRPICPIEYEDDGCIHPPPPPKLDPRTLWTGVKLTEKQKKILYEARKREEEEMGF